MKLIIIILLFIPALISAEIYKTVNKNGRVVFTDKPTVEAQEVDVETNINNADGLSGSAYSKRMKLNQKNQPNRKQ